RRGRVLMSDVERIVEQARTHDVALYLKEGRLAYTAFGESFPAELKTKIAENKDAIIDYLRRSGTGDAGKATAYPLSFAQQRLWFLDHFEGVGAGYNTSVALRLTGSLDRDALRRAFDEIVARHAVLRSTYRGSRDGGEQLIHAASRISIAFTDLAASAPAVQDEQIRRISFEQSSAPFDLARDLMRRVAFWGLWNPQYGLCVAMHPV